jgi:DNA-binding CsgD family transcriptional regulator
MSETLELLSEREKETLRLLLAGHDAKSSARAMNLSVHTINDYLRSARRKLSVGSSREAARMLGVAELASPPETLAPKRFGDSKTHVDEQFGIAERGGPMTNNEHSHPPPARGRNLAWLAGGMLIMSLLIAAAIILMPPGAEDASLAQTRESPANSASQEAASADAARNWVAMLDRRDWSGSWNAAGALFQQGVSAEVWASTVEPLRAPLGSANSRVFQKVTRATELPGAPDGEYELLGFCQQGRDNRNRGDGTRRPKLARGRLFHALIVPKNPSLLAGRGVTGPTSLQTRSHAVGPCRCCAPAPPPRPPRSPPCASARRRPDRARRTRWRVRRRA